MFEIPASILAYDSRTFLKHARLGIAPEEGGREVRATAGLVEC
jgi:hypothetical protein